MISAFLSGLEKAPTFLVPIINPPFADTARTSYRTSKISARFQEGVKSSFCHFFTFPADNLIF